MFNWKKKKGRDSTPTHSYRQYDEDGYLIEAEESYYDDLDWNKKYSKKQDKFDWEEYKKSGKWGGYSSYKPSVLTYSYVSQMANAIASQNNVKIVVGNNWEVDLVSKTLTYNPTSLMFGSKGELLATLLHEVGKIKLCQPYNELKSTYLQKYTSEAYKVVSVFDDFRVDDVMIKAYPAAEEVYQSQSATLDKVVDAHIKKGAWIRTLIQGQLRNIAGQISYSMNQGQTFTQAYKNIFGTISPLCNSVADIIKVFSSLADEPLLPEYLAVVVTEGYGLNRQDNLRPDMITRYESTKGAIPKILAGSTTQNSTSVCDTYVFPLIEDLLKINKEGTKSMQDTFGKAVSQSIMNSIASQIESEGGVSTNPYKSSARGVGRGDQSVPKEWTTGEYAPLKESVDGEIRSLYAKLLNVRKKENIIKHEPNHRRGKLNTKSLYRFATGNNRVFKKKLENTDTIRSFVFSILVDYSGSMDGANIIHATRSLILLSEVFTKLSMPFEIIYFDTSPNLVKGFDDDYKKKIQGKIAGLSQHSGGGTTLSSALKATSITKRTELNKVLVILTDGDTESHEYLDQEYFIPFRKKGVKTIPIGIDCGKSIESMAEGTGRDVKIPANLPSVFYDMMKELVIKK